MDLLFVVASMALAVYFFSRMKGALDAGWRLLVDGDHETVPQKETHKQVLPSPHVLPPPAVSLVPQPPAVFTPRRPAIKKGECNKPRVSQQLFFGERHAKIVLSMVHLANP